MNLNEALRRRVSQALTVVGPCATLAVSPSTNYDPINLIKLVFVFGIAFYVCGLYASQYKVVWNLMPKALKVAFAIFLISMTLTLFVSGAPFNQQIWGSFGRNTGYLTYVSLISLMVCAIATSKGDLSEKIIKSLIYTTIPLTLYCLLQVANQDPIPWSEKLPFGTLGNINFSSAYFGLSSIACLGYLFVKKISNFARVNILVMVLMDLVIVYSTGSIQGIMIFAAGSSFILFSYIRNSGKLRLLKYPYLLSVFVGIFVVILGLTNRGPLAKLLFAPSIVFRTDYWHAGWKMTLERPFFGVGLDSYGDWYRQARGYISTTRNSPDRISNTAHNIFLDLSSNGGFILLAAYLLIVIYTLLQSFKYFRRTNSFDPIFTTLFSVWLGFMVMSLVSINQIGVGIWGWLFNGSLIGYVRVNGNLGKIGISEEIKYSKTLKKMKRSSISQIPAGSSLIALIALFIGVSLAYIPLRADAAYRSALNSNALDKIITSTRLVGSTSFHSELALDLAIRNNLTTQAYEITKYMVEKYPRDFMGWKSLWLITVSTPEEKDLAHKKLLEQDPFNPTVK